MEDEDVDQLAVTAVSDATAVTVTTGDGGEPEDPSREPEDPISEGASLGHYTLQRRLGVGGMGEVYAARDLERGDTVALKLLSKTSATRLYRFKREFRALADIEHRNLIRLRELVVPAAGQPYFTMEQVEGLPFVSWVRMGAASDDALPDLARLEGALAQLAAAVAHLHQHGFVHRDLKPSNVLVDGDGRVVVLDFGLVSEVAEPDRGVTHEGQLIGTPVYMAPEQARGERAGPAADLYAIGVMLFECLTGRTPFTGSALAVLAHKVQDAVPDPAAIVAGIPAHLRQFCMGLLAQDPEQRPSGAAMLARLGRGVPDSVEVGESSRLGHAPAFVGRDRELATLRAALRQVAERERGVVVTVSGASGFGKSALLRRFRAELDDGAVVLWGRCRERESLPYKGVDAIIDALSVYLRHLEPAALAELEPPDLDALVRVFPVFDEIWPPSKVQQLLDLGELRNLAWHALGELLARLSARASVLVHVDDFQWTDADSVALLRTVMSGPRAPAMLLVLSQRDGAAPFVPPLPSDIELRLGPLAEAEAEALAEALLRERGGDPATRQRRAQAIALRAGGNPMFIAQMSADDGGAFEDADLEQLLTRRLAGLAPRARALLEVVAVAGGPVALATARALCADDDDDGGDDDDGDGDGDGDDEEHSVALLRQNLLVSDGAAAPVVELAHDRIRTSLLRSLAPARVQDLHREFARRLLAEHGHEAPGELLFAIADHLAAGKVELDGGGQRLELAQLFCRAGERALASTAWASAWRYLGLARALIDPWLADPAARAEHRSLCFAVVLAHAQAWAMCAGEAADAGFDELLGWTLSIAEFGEVVARHLAMLALQDRPVALVDRALAALAHLAARGETPRAASLGLSGTTSLRLLPLDENPGARRCVGFHHRLLGVTVAKHPSSLPTRLAVYRGWRALGGRSPEALRALPPVADPRARARMDIIAATLAAAVLVDNNLYMSLTGRYAQLIAAHGFHERTAYALSCLAYCVSALGRASVGGALCERALALGDERAPADSLLAARVIALLFVWPRCRPFSGLLAELGPAHDRACELGQRRIASYLAVVGAGLHLEGGSTLATVAGYLDHAEQRNPGFGGDEYRKIAEIHRGYLRSLIEGAPFAGEGLDALYGATRYLGVVTEVGVAIFLGHHDQALARAQTIAHDYAANMRGSWNVPRFAMLYAIALGQALVAARGRAARKLRRQLRACRATVLAFERDCPDNYAPMRSIIDAELAAARGRGELATQFYERARVMAAAQDRHGLTGLAADEAALAAYRRWGATAVVDRLTASLADVTA